MIVFYVDMVLSVFGIVLLTVVAQGSGVETGVHWEENKLLRDKVFDNPLQIRNAPTELINCVIYCLGVSGCKHVLMTRLSWCWLFKDLQGAQTGVGSRIWSKQTAATAPVTTTEVAPVTTTEVAPVTTTDVVVPKSCLPSYKYNTVYDSCLYLKKYPYKNYTDAKEDCIADGARLVVVDTKKKHEEMNNFERLWIWIGAEKISGSWKWNNGMNVDTLPRFWVPGQPSNKTLETCMFVIPGGSNVAGFDDNTCHSKSAYVCEYILN